MFVGLNVASMLISAVMIFNPFKQVPTWPSVVGFAEMFKEKTLFLKKIYIYNFNYWVKSRVNKKNYTDYYKMAWAPDVWWVS